MNKNRYIALLLAFILLFPAAFSIVNAENDAPSEDYELLRFMNITDDALEENQDYISRGDVAYYSEKLLNMSDAPFAYIGYFMDIDEGASFASAVEHLASLGILNGNGEQKYYPTKPATINEAVKILVELCGYRYMANIKGGYPYGHIYTAKSIGILKGIKNTDGFLEKDVFKQLLYNTLFVAIAEIDSVIVNENGSSQGYAVDESKTVLSEYFDMHKADGVIQAVEYINYSGISLDKNEVLIDGFKMRDTTNKSADYLGYNVKYIYKKYDAEIPELIYFTPDDTSVVELSGNDVTDLSGTMLTYAAETKTKAVNISSTASIIYNFKKVPFESKYIENLNHARIKLISNEGSGSQIDYIIVETFKDIVVDTMNSLDKSVTSMADITKKLSLDEDKYEVLILVDDKGESVSFDEIVSETVISYACDAALITNAKILKCYISFDNKVGVLESKSTAGALNKCTINGDKYVCAYGCVASDDMLSQEVKAYFNVFGEISYLDMDTAGGFENGFIIAVGKKSRIDVSCQMKLYTTKDEEKILDFADKVKINGTSTDEADIDVTDTKFNPGIVFYKLNAKGEISTIEKPVAEADYVDGRFCISYPKANSYSYMSNRTISVKIVNHEDKPDEFKQLVVGDNTAMYRVGEAGGVIDADSVSVITTSALGDRVSRTVEAYSASKDAVESAALLLFSISGDKISGEYNMLAVSSVTEEIDEMGNIETKLRGINQGAEEILTVSDKCKTEDGIAFASLNVNPGDVIRYELDTKAKVKLIQKVYSAESGCTMGSDVYNNNDYNDNPYIAFARAVSVDNSYIKYSLYNEYASFNADSWMNNYLTIRKSRYSVITVVDVSGRNPQVYAGKIGDVGPGDTFIIYTNLMAPRAFVLIKGLNN